MRKLLWAVGALVVLCGLAVVIVPNVIDWNAYKPEIAELVRKHTGRELIIAGDIDMEVLPAPKLIAANVSLGSIEGATSPDLASVRLVEVRIALAPLLGGNIRIETIRLVEPQIYLEILTDGRNTWTIAPAKEAEPRVESEPTQAADGAGGGGPAVILDSFEIADGSVTYQDTGAGTVEQVRGINLNIAAASLSSGPFRAVGDLNYKDLRLGIDANIGEIVGGRTFPLDLTVGLAGDGAKIKLEGTVLGLNESPRFKGDLRVDSDNVGRVVGALANGATLPEPLSQAFELQGSVDASEAAFALDRMTFSFGGAEGTGNIVGQLNGTPKIAAELQIDKIDVDPWIAEKPAPSASGDSAPETKAAPSDLTTSQPASSDSAFSLPGGMVVTLASRFGEVALKGDLIRNVVLNAELANGEITLSQFSLLGPGGTDAALFGFLTAKDGVPSFDGEFEGNIRNFQALMNWAGVESGLKDGRPGAIEISTAFNATPSTVTVRKLSVGFDETKALGAATIALGERLGIGASLNIDKLNLDTYLGGTPANDGTAGSPAGSSGAGDGSAGGAGAGSGPIEGIAALAGFDANIAAKIGQLTTQGVPIKEIEADLSLIRGDLTIKKFSVADAASVTANVSGVLAGLSSVPNAKQLAIRAKVVDPGRLAGIGGFDLPLSAKTLGAIGFDATVDGSLLAPKISSTVTAMAATVSANGKLSLLNPVNMFDLVVRFGHNDTAGLIRKLGGKYRPSGNIGGMDVSSKIVGGPGGFNFSELTAGFGPLRLQGAGNVDLSGARPKITATLNTNNVLVDPFMPAKSSASLRAPRNSVRVVPAAMLIPEGQARNLLHLIATVSERWSPVPFDLDALKLVDADLAMTAPRVTYHEYNLDSAKLNANLSNGLMNINEFSGTVFGGNVMSTAAIDASGERPLVAAQVNVGGMDIGAASKAAGIASASGSLTSRIEVSSAGYSIADWVSGLNGKGAIEVRGIKGRNSLADMPVIGLALGPLMQVFEVLNSGLGSLIGKGGKTGLGETDVTSSFTISNGTLNTRDTKITSNIYEGNISGDVNLPLWSMNVGGKVAVDQGLLGAVLANVARLPSEIPFQVTGNIDKPNVKIQSFSGATSQGAGSGIKIPGLDKLDKKAPGVGGLLQGILGGGSSPQPTPAPQTEGEPPAQDGSSPPPQQAPPQEKVNPAEQLFKQLFK